MNREKMIEEILKINPSIEYEFLEGPLSGLPDNILQRFYDDIVGKGK